MGKKALLVVSFGTSFEAVSYTHLDVYKRQEQTVRWRCVLIWH